MMERHPPEAAFSQVVFTDIPHSYPPSTHITCCYTAAFQPDPRDWVGIFKVGWSTTKDYHTFVWVEPCLDVEDQQSSSMQAAFKDYYLPKDEIEFYQFCYIDSNGKVRGASTPFCFKNPAEQSLDSSPDDDLLVITTQEQVEQSVREKAELMQEVAQIRMENEALKSALQKEQQEVGILKVENEQKKKYTSELEMELDLIKEQNQKLTRTLQDQLQESDHEMLIQMTSQVMIQKLDAAEPTPLSDSLCADGASRQNKTQQKYDRAVMKINQLKEERLELKGRVDVQEEEITKLNTKLREAEWELLKTGDIIQLLQVDLQSSEKEKGRFSAELDEVQIENQELRQRSYQQETPQSCPDDDLRVQCQTLRRQLQDAQTELVAAKDESRNSRRRAECLDRELQQVREQLEKEETSCKQAQLKSGQQEMQLREAHEVIVEKDRVIEEKESLILAVKHAKEKLARENQKLRSDMEELQGAPADPHGAPADPHAASVHPDTTTHCEPPQEETPEQSTHRYDSTESIAEPEKELSLVCRHCQEVFPGINQIQLEQHEQSHRVCPFCTLICDSMEQSVFEDHVYSHEL